MRLWIQSKRTIIKMQSLQTLLDNGLCPENVTRRQAEEELLILSQRPGFFLKLLNTSPTLTPKQRFVAWAMVKQHAAKGIASSSEWLELLPLLMTAVANEEVSNAAALLASATAKVLSQLNDAEVSLSTVTDHLATMLQGGLTILAQQNALRLALELLTELSDDRSSLCIAPLAPILLSMTLDECNDLHSIRLPALHIVAEIVERSPPTNVPSLAEHLDALVAIAMNSLSLSDVDCNGYVLEALGIVLSCIDIAMPQIVSSPHFLMLLLQSIEVSVEDWRDVSGDADDEVITSLTRVASRRWEILTVIFKKKKYAKQLVRLTSGMSSPIFQLMMEACVLPMRQVQEWECDPIAFIRHESERRDEISWAPRDVAADCAQVVAARLGAPFLKAVMEGAAEVLFAGTAVSADNWRLREAILFIIGSLIDHRMDLLKAHGMSDFGNLVAVVLNIDVSPAAPAVLQARGLAVLEAIVRSGGKKGAQKTLCDMLLEPCVASIRHTSLSGTCSLVTSAAASLLGVVTLHCGAVDGEVFDTGLAALLDSIVIPSLSDDLLYLHLETLLEWLRKCPQVVPTMKALPAAAVYLLNSWGNHLKDPNVGELVADIFDLIARNALGDKGILDRMAWMRDVLAGHVHAELLCVTPYIVKMTTSILLYGSEEVANAAGSELLSPLCQLLLTNDDSSVAVASSECLAALLRRAGEGLEGLCVAVTPSLVYGVDSVQAPRTPPLRSLASKPTGTMSPLPPLDEQQELAPLSDVLIAIASTLLRDDRSEVSLMNVGKYLRAVAEVAFLFSTEQMTTFLRFVTRRLFGLQTSSACCELLLPLSCFLERYQVPFLDIMNQFQCLPNLFELWLPRLPVFAEEGSCTVVQQTCASLVSLLEHWPQELDYVTVVWKASPQQRATPMPLSSAIFLALGKTVCFVMENYFMFASNNEERDERASDDDKDDSDEESEDDCGEGTIPQELSVVESQMPTCSSGNLNEKVPLIPPQLKFLERLVPMVPQFAQQTMTYFSPSELSKLQDFVAI